MKGYTLAEKIITISLALAITTFLITFAYLVFTNKPIEFNPGNYIPLFEIYSV